MSGLDRREFLGVALASGVLAGAFVPLEAAACDPLAADWHVDDILGPTPPYAHPIPHARRGVAPLADGIDPVDRALIL